MTNPQLIDFIKQQLQVGLTKEKISSELLANGWNSQDIEEGFKATGTPIPSTPFSNTTPVLNPNISTYINNNDNLTSFTTKKQSGKKLFFIILLILFLLAGGASAYYFKDNLINLPIIKDLFLTQNVMVLPEVPAQTNEISAVTQQLVAGDIKTNFTDCGEADLVFNNSKESLNMTLNMNSLIKKSKDALKCYTSILKTCTNGKVLLKSNGDVAVSISPFSNDLCSIKFNVVKNPKPYLCTFSKILPDKIFIAAIKDPKNKIYTTEEMEISDGFGFQSALSIYLALQSMSNTSKGLSQTDIIINDFFGSKVACKEVFTPTSVSTSTPFVKSTTVSGLKPYQIRFISPAEDTRIPLEGIVQLKIQTGEKIKKVQLSFDTYNLSYQNYIKDVEVPVQSGYANYLLNVQDTTLVPITIMAKGISDDSNNADYSQYLLKLTKDEIGGMFLRLILYTDRKVDVFRLEKDDYVVNYMILGETLPAPGFLAGFVGYGLIPVSSSDVEFKVDSPDMVQLIKTKGSVSFKGLKNGESKITATYKGLSEEFFYKVGGGGNP